MSVENCANCLYSHKAPVDEAKLCRRYPPQVTISPTKDNMGFHKMLVQAFYPQLATTEWCGEWQVKPGESN